jgi:ABC-2 type transport system ATP-binding protein
MAKDGGNAVEVTGLCREYRGRKHGRRQALDGLDLRIAVGQVHGLLGPNGAGKTTLCKILATLLLPSAGTALVAGHDVVADPGSVQRAVGIVLGGERGLYTRLSARQNLMFWAALYRQPTRVARHRVDALLERVGLRDRAHERVETFSRGMKQRLHLARGLVGDPVVVVLDEPTIGMDPVAARDFRALVGELRDDGRTILLTTHDMAEAEAVCDRVSLIDNGRLLGTEDPTAIGRWLSMYERVTASEVPEAVTARLRDLPGVREVRREADGRVTFETALDGAAGHVVHALVNAGVTRVSTGRPSLEEVYLQLMGDRGANVR